MLARLESTLPRGPEWRYEPKLDGFRGLLWRSNTGAARVLSRNLKDLSVSFPELVRASEALPLDTVIDGEIVIADADGSSDFGALQQRLGVGRRDAARSAQQIPAVLLAFDVVRCEGADLAGQPLRDRRAILEGLLAANPACLQLIAQTDAVEEAEDWLRLVPNIEGVVAKRWDGRYLPGQREWVKVKRRRTVDCVVIGIAGDHTRPWLVLGLRHADGRLHHLGRLGSVICHFERAHRVPLQTRQRVLGRQYSQEQRCVFGEKTLSVRSACGEFGFKARPLLVAHRLSSSPPHASDVASDLLKQLRVPGVEGVAAAARLEAYDAN